MGFGRGLVSSTVRTARWGSFLVCVYGLVPAAWAQSGVDDGAITGRVFSAAGNALEGAVVVLRGVDTGLELATRTGTNGEFIAARLPVGAYSVTVEDAMMQLDDPGPVMVRLGEVTEVVEWMRRPASGSVTGAVEALQAAGEVTAGKLAALPIDGGQWRSLALAASGANDVAGDDESQGEVSYRGVATTENSSRIDGASSDSSFAATPSGAGVPEEADADVEPDRANGTGLNGGHRAGASYTFAEAAVREFRVQGQGDAASYGSALYGHGVGGVVTVATERGSGTLHAMGFYTLRDSAWAAANPFSIATTYANGAVTTGLVKPQDIRRQFGGRVGGPMPVSPEGRGHILHERLFYFYAFDRQQRDFPAVSSPAYAGFYSLTATQTALLGNRGVSATKTNAALNYLSSLTGTLPRQSDQAIDFGRLDWQGRGAGRGIAEYNRARWDEPAGARSGAVVNRGLASFGSSYGKVDAGVARWVMVPSHRLSNELRLEFGRQLQYEQDQAPLPQEPQVGPGGLPPEVAIGPDGLVYGTPAGLGQKAYPEERRLGVAEVLAWVGGRNLLQAGVDFAALQDSVDSLTNAEGTFSYDSGTANGKAGGLVDWITDYTFSVNAYPNGACPSIVAAIHRFCYRSYSQSFGQQSVRFATEEWAGFVQDDWRVRPGLTIHAGLRYEYQALPLPQLPNPALDAIFGAVAATAAFPADRNNVGPRLGAVIEPFGQGRGVLRIGYGVYFGKLPGATVRAALLDTAMASSTTSVRILPTTETLCPQNAEVSFGYACSYLAAPVGVVAATTSAVVFDRSFRLPAVQQGTLSFERGVGWGVTAKAGYTMNLDRQLPNSVDINIAPSTRLGVFQLQGGTGAIGVRDAETFVMPVYTARVSTSFGPVTDVISNANATYNGLTVELARGARERPKFGKGLEFRVGLTWSKALDYGQTGGAVPRTNNQTDPFTVRYDKGLSALDFPRKIAATMLWTPRLDPESRRWVRMLGNGWSLAGIFSMGSGRGYSYEIFGGTRLSGGHESINGSGGSVVLPTVGRDTLRLPDTSNLNVRVARSLHIPRTFESLRLKGTADVFNALNREKISGVTQRAYLAGTPVAGITPLVFQNAATVAAEGLNVRPFGAYTAAGTSQARERQIQVGLRIEF